MLFRLLRLRDHGHLLPRYRLALPTAPTGRLLVSETHDSSLGRSVRTAKFLDHAGAIMETVPPLHDVSLVHFSSGRMSLSGVEYLPDEMHTRVSGYAQSWILTVDGDPDSAPAENTTGKLTA